jgi:hypothetical protein
VKNKMTWKPDKDEEGWNSACGRYRIVRCLDFYGEGHYYKLCWSGYFGQTCQREYDSLGSAKRAAALRAREKEVAA